MVTQNMADRRSGPATDLPCAAESSIITRNAEMQALIKQAKKIAATEATVLVTGETGTGKELFAKLLHQASPRRGQRFEAVNCAAFSSTLLSSELFGHEKGSFTGADAQRKGLFEIANGGTVFLDEIGDMDLADQASLLRVIEDRRIRRVGGSAEIPVDFRLVAATNRELMVSVAAGRFREDLYYRLKVIELSLPPLRDRPEDILPIFSIALAAASRPELQLSDAARDQVVGHPWPGNVRQLIHTATRAAALTTDGQITVEDLGLHAPDSIGELLLPRGLSLIEAMRQYAVAAVGRRPISTVASELKVSPEELNRLLNGELPPFARQPAVGSSSPPPPQRQSQRR